MKKKMLRQLLYIYSDQDMSHEAREKQDSLAEYIKSFTGKADDEQMDDLIYSLVDVVFMDGASMLLDFISGKENAPATKARKG